MLPLSIGIAIAVGFAALAGFTYGFDELLSGSWLLLVIWGLIAGPALMFVAGSRDRNGSWRDRPKA